MTTNDEMLHFMNKFREWQQTESQADKNALYRMLMRKRNRLMRMSIEQGCTRLSEHFDDMCTVLDTSQGIRHKAALQSIARRLDSDFYEHVRHYPFKSYQPSPFGTATD